MCLRTGEKGVGLMRVILGVLFCAGALGVAAQVRVEGGYVRAMPPGQPTTAAYLTLVNSGDRAVEIDRGSSDIAARVEFHTHVHRDGMMSMQQLPGITVPAKGTFVFEPGVKHLMLIGLKAPLHVGDTVKLRLFSGNSEVVKAELPVRSVLSETAH